jgi:hypothetical protein
VKRFAFARIFWLGAAGIVALAALVALVAILGGGFSDTDARILITLAALLYAGGAGIAGLVLADRGPARTLGWLVAVASPVCFVFEVVGIWSFVVEGDGGNEAIAKLAWSAVLVLLAGLLSTTDLLLARGDRLVRLAGLAGALAASAVALSIIGIWAEPSGDAFVKAVAVLWICTGLAYFLVPILGRFSSAGEPPSERVLAELGDVELVATRARNGMDVRLRPGERLQLRRRS